MTDYEKLKNIVDEIDVLISRRVRSSVPAFETWYTKAERLLIKVYGQGSYEHEKFTSTHFSPMIWNLDDEEEVRRIAIQRCSEGLRSCKSIFNIYLEEMSERKEIVKQEQKNKRPTILDRVFIVHGHDGELK